MTIHRKYQMTRVAAGDYLLPSNDGEKLWRLRKIIEGPSSGLMDMPADKEFWGIWQWSGPLTEIDVEDWGRWDFYEGMHETRRSAIDSALKPKTPPPCSGKGRMTLDEAIRNMAATD